MMRIATVLSVVAVLAACSEKPQTAGSLPKSDSPAWQGGQAAYTTPGWKAGDKAAWENQIHQRNQAQNEYSRSPAAPKAP